MVQTRQQLHLSQDALVDLVFSFVQRYPFDGVVSSVQTVTDLQICSVIL